MKIRKETHETLDSVAALLQPQYPGAAVTKPFLSGKILTVPYENIKFIMRDKKDHLFVDIIPGAGQRTVGVLFGAIGLLISKAIFKSRNKEKIQNFLQDAEMIINKGGIESIGTQLV